MEMDPQSLGQAASHIIQRAQLQARSGDPNSPNQQVVQAELLRVSTQVADAPAFDTSTDVDMLDPPRASHPPP